MSLRQYLLIMTLGAILCWVAWGMVIMNVDPFQEALMGFVFFYFSLFLALLGTFSLFSFLFYYYFSSTEILLFKAVERSFVWAFLISFILVFLLFLQGQGYLRWWNFGIFMGLIFFMALLKFSKKKFNNNDQLIN